MSRFIVRSRIDADGVLRLAVPLGVADADREVQITIEPASPLVHPQQNYVAWLDSIAGAWQGEFEHMPVGSFEPRDSL